MSHASRHQHLFKAIKSLLKARRIRYEDLARHLVVSLPTVKKFMTDGRIDLDRLQSICDLLQITVLDLFTMTREQQNQPLTFTDEQQEFFAEHMNYYCYLCMLQKGLTPHQIAQQYKLSSRSTREYLKKLELMGFLNRLPGDNIRLHAQAGRHVWDDFGPMGRMYMHYYIQTMADRAKEALISPTRLKIWSGRINLTSTQYEDYAREMDQLRERYIMMSSVNRASGVATDPIQHLFLADVWHDPYFDSIPEIE